MSRIYLGISGGIQKSLIRPITNTLKNKKKSVKSLFQICVIRAFWVSPESSPGGQVDSRKGHRASKHSDPIDRFGQDERGSDQCDEWL